MAASNSKAAAILRASLRRATDVPNTTGGTPGGAAGSSSATHGGRRTSASRSAMNRSRSHRRNDTHDTIDANFCLDGEEAAAGIEDPAPLTGTGAAGPAATVHDGHGDIEASLHSADRRPSLPRRVSATKLASSLMRSTRDLSDVDLDSPTSAAGFPGELSPSKKPGLMTLDSTTSDGGGGNHPHHTHDSFLIRFMHSRWMQIGAAVATVCLIGAVAGVASTRGNTALAQGGSGGYVGGGSGIDDTHGYYPEPVKPEEPVDDPTGTGTGTYDAEEASSSSSGGQDQQEQQPQEQKPQEPSTPTTTTSSSTPTWLEGPHFTDPTLTTVGSTLSFSADGTRLAISSKHSSTIQIMKLQADGYWSQLGESLPGKVAALSGDGTRVAIADSSESSVTTYQLSRNGRWTIYGTRLIDLWGARSVSLDRDGTTLAISHYPDSICRICPSVATVYELRTDGEEWLQEYDMIGAYDFDFSVVLSGDGNTLAFSGRVYENAVGVWNVKSSFPDFISSHSALSSSGTTAAVSLPDCHIFKNTDPTLTECTNNEKHEVSVMEYRVTGTGEEGWWNRKGISIGPDVNGLAGTTSISISEDGNTVAIAVGGRGMGGEAAIETTGDNDDILAGEALNGPVSSYNDEPMPLDDDSGPLRRRLQDTDARGGDDSNEDFMGYDNYDVEEAYVRVYRYDESTGDWSAVGRDIVLDTSGATVTLSADGKRLAVGVPYGGEEERGYVKVYDLVMQ